MKRYITLLLIFLSACGVPAPVPVSQVAASPTPQPVIAETVATREDARPFPQHVPYAGILPNHRTQQQLDEDVIRFYEYWKQTYLVREEPVSGGDPFYRVAFGKDAEARKTTVSEGQGYGMIIVPLMAGYDPQAREIFDGLWRFVRAHPSEIDPRLMDWNIPEPEGNASAFDGDADIAFGLLLADAQWGNAGQVDYKAEALQMISGILESTIGAESRLPMLGDWVEQNGAQYNQFTPRSSDFMLVNFRAFGKATDDPVWDEVARQSQAVMLQIQDQYSPQAGLMPDFIVRTNGAFRPAPEYFLENITDGEYNYNAGRVPWRVGLDALLNDNETSRAIAVKISQWIETEAGGEAGNIRAGYRLDGSPLPDSEYFSTFFVAPLGVAAMNNPAQQGWLNRIYDAVYDTHQDYYEDSVTLLCLLAMSGNFWLP